jgi:tetratricopeptide (TPR) repeat protein
MRLPIALITLALASQPLFAADTTAPETAALPSIEAAKTALDAGDFPTAQRLLAQLAVDQPKNADVWNLLGYTNRNMKLHGPALDAYEMALNLDPKHLGALEYQGELFVTLKRMDDAKANLAKLKDLCKDCEEMQDLQAAIDAAPAE